MPWHVAQSASCPPSRPWAVVNSQTGHVMGCHPSKASALKQLAALNVAEPQQSKQEDEMAHNTNFPRDDLYRALRRGTEVRATDDGVSPVLHGHFAVFDEWVEIDSLFEGRFLERIARGAFRKTFREHRDQMRVLFQHGRDPVVGNKPLGPIDMLREDERGAAYEVPMVDTDYNRELLPGLRAGLYGASFRFRVVKEDVVEDPGEAEHNPEGLPERTLKEVRVFEFGPVTFPAYASASAHVRSLTDEILLDRLAQEPEWLERLNSRLGVAATMPVIVGERGPEALVPASGDEDRDADDETTDANVRAEDDVGAEPAHSDEALSEAEPVDHSDGTGSRDDRQQDDDDEGRQDVAVLTIEELRERQDEIQDRLTEIHREYGADLLPDDVRAEFDDLVREREKNERRIQEYEDRENAIRVGANDPRRSERSVRVGRTLEAPASRLPSNIYALEEYRAFATNADELPGLYREGAARILESATFPHPRADASEVREHIHRLLERDLSGDLAQRIIATSSKHYARAFGKAWANMPLTAEEQRALSLTTTAGGFAVPYVLDPTIIPTSNASVNPFRQIARVESITVDDWKGVSSAGVTASYAAEAAEATDDAPTLAQPAVSSERAHVFIPFSMEIGSDWGSLQSEMARLVQDAKDDLEADKFVTGLGSGSNQPQGLLVGGTAVVTTAGTATIAVGDLYTLEQTLPPRFRPRASIVANRAQFNRVRQLDTAGGASLWIRIGDGLPNVATGALGEALMGYPTYEASAMTTAVTSASSAITIGDFSHYLIVERVGMNVELLPHLLGSNRRPTGQRGLYFFWRNSAVVLAWQAFRTLKTL